MHSLRNNQDDHKWSHNLFLSLTIKYYTTNKIIGSQKNHFCRDITCIKLQIKNHVHHILSSQQKSKTHIKKWSTCNLWTKPKSHCPCKPSWKHKIIQDYKSTEHNHMHINVYINAHFRFEYAWICCNFKLLACRIFFIIWDMKSH